MLKTVWLQAKLVKTMTDRFILIDRHCRACKEAQKSQSQMEHAGRLTDVTERELCIERQKKDKVRLKQTTEKAGNKS